MQMQNGSKKILTSIFLFFVSGLFEIGGGYLVWLWLREDFSWMLGAVGGFVLFLYGIVPTFQKTHFHSLRSLWWSLYCNVSVLGLVDRWNKS
jgi:small multidrug resistance family-3 protein